MNNNGGVFGALLFVAGALIAFAVLFGFFLIVPFFVFLGALIWMLINDRRSRREEGASTDAGSADQIEATGEAREVKP